MFLTSKTSLDLFFLHSSHKEASNLATDPVSVINTIHNADAQKSELRMAQHKKIVTMMVTTSMMPTVIRPVTVNFSMSLEFCSSFASHPYCWYTNRLISLLILQSTRQYAETRTEY